MIRDIRNGRAVGCDSVGDRWSRVIQVLCFNQDFTDAEKAFFQFRVVDAAGEVLKLDREIRILHLAGKRIFQTSLKRYGAVDVQLGSRKKGWSKEGKTLDVIPMRMSDQKMDAMRGGAAEHVQAENTYPRAAVEYKCCALLGA